MDKMPLFPLHTVLFPKMPLHLTIFEERYRSMLHYCLEKERPFGIILIRQGEETGDDPVVPYLTGCSTHIIHIEPQDSGQIKLDVLGLERFRILSIHQEHPFLTAETETFPLDLPPEVEPFTQESLSLRLQIKNYISTLSLIGQKDVDIQQLRLPDDPWMILFLAASILQIPIYEKQNLLEISAAGQFLAEVQRLYKREISVLNHLQNSNFNPYKTNLN